MLEASRISVRFGGVLAVQDVDLRVEDKQVVGIVGPNGSGKTTLLNALTGVVRASGTLHIDGKPVPLGAPRRVHRAGVSRVFQHPQTFQAITVVDNVLLGHRDQTATGLTAALFLRPVMQRRDRQRRAAALDALADVGLLELAEVSASQLTYGQQRLLEIARALCASPRVLLLDEPSAGLNDDETDGLIQLLDAVRQRCAVVIVDHKIPLINRLCDHVVVMELGAKIAAGTPREVWADERVATAYLGARRSHA